MCLSPRSPSRLGIVKSWNIEVGRDPRDRRGSSAPGGVRVGIASLERREREWDFSRLPWPVTRGIGIVNPYSRPGSCGRNPNVLTSFFLLALNANVNHNGKMMAISSILSNSDNGGILHFLFFFWLSNQLENEDRHSTVCFRW